MLAAIATAVAIATGQHCALGPFERCLLNAVDIALTRAGAQTRVTTVHCNRSKTRCELIFDRGRACVTARIQLVEHRTRWQARLGHAHACQR